MTSELNKSNKVWIHTSIHKDLNTLLNKLSKDTKTDKFVIINNALSVALKGDTVKKTAKKATKKTMPKKTAKAGKK